MGRKLNRKERKEREERYRRRVGCERKIRHEDKLSAEAHMDVLKLIGEGHLHVYECPYCVIDGQPGWHVGHKHKRRRS
jgi:hypothetical protein